MDKYNIELISVLTNSIIDDSFLFEVDDLKIDTSKLIGEVASDLSFGQHQNDLLLFANVLDHAAARRISIVGEFISNSTIAADSLISFTVNAFYEEDNFTFQSLSERIDFERERVFQILIAQFLKIRVIFANLSFIELIVFIVVNSGIFNQQFGGNRDLPVITT